MKSQSSMKAQETDHSSGDADRMLHQRAGIDDIDQKLLELLKQRAQLALEIGRHKQKGGQPVFAPQRENVVIRRLREGDCSPLSPGNVEAVFREIISACRGLQAELRAAFLGPEFSFSHQAALGIFGKASSLSAQSTVRDVFHQVEKGKCQAGLIPVENSSQGGVGSTFDNFFSSDLKVCGEVYQNICQVLMSRESRLQDIQAVYSHPQALAQCSGWLRKNLPWADLREDASTAAAATRASRESNIAAIGSDLAAKHARLNSLARGIEDSTHNVTRFLVLAGQDCPPSGEDKTSLLFTTKHQPGALHRALASLARAELDLTFIESRPLKERPWEYGFFVDILGHARDLHTAEALKTMQSEVAFIKILGSYPRGRKPEQTLD